ncbi:MAG: ABC transporter substrate-binding protein [Clostridia bacterium]|nr:ABC transporter substrate-binding protein [Clostridia bacterium]
MKKVISVILASVLALSVLALASCSQNNEEKLDEIRVYTLMGPTGMGMAKLIADDKDGKTAQNYTFTVASAPDQISAEVIKGEFEIAAVPVNLASVLYNKTEGQIKVAAVNTLGVLYVLENGNAINSVSDLKGQKIYATGQGATPEYTLRYILSKNGIDPDKDVTVEYMAEHAELATQMASGSVTLGMLPEPNVTSVLLNNGDVRIALDLTEEWKKVSDTDLVQGVIIVSKKFADGHPQALKTFLEEYKASVEYVNGSADDASALIEAAGIVPKAAIAKKALPNCNIVFVSGDEMKASVSAMLGVLYESAPKSVGGKLPDDAFYYAAK